MPETRYEATRPKDGHRFGVYDARLAEHLSAAGWRVTAETRSDA